MRRTAVSSALALCFGLAASGAKAEDVFGYWLTENGSAIIEIRPCGDGVCGQTAWLKNPRHDTGETKRDENNPDPALRARSLCGLTLLRGVTRKRDGWEGAIYSPRHGDTFSAELNAKNRETLEVRGYVGLPFFGSSQNWVRVPNNRGGC